MKPWLHAKSSAKKFGGEPDDYIDIHDWFDSTKAAMADVRHRAVLHNAFGIYLAEQVFGHFITNSAGKEVSVRDVGEQHVLEDLGRIPSIQDWLVGLEIQGWMGPERDRRKTTTITSGTAEVKRDPEDDVADGSRPVDPEADEVIGAGAEKARLKAMIAELKKLAEDIKTSQAPAVAPWPGKWPNYTLPDYTLPIPGKWPNETIVLD